MGDLLALSVQQPWCFALVKGWKPVENRTWRPPSSALGRRHALHASARIDMEGVPDFSAILRLPQHRPPEPVTLAQMPLGAITGTARLLGAVEVDGVSFFHPRRHPARVVQVFGHLTDAQVELVLRSEWTAGTWAWLWDQPQEIKPIPCKGALGMWRVPDDIAARVRELEVQSRG
jgi:hypothetical protein